MRFSDEVIEDAKAGKAMVDSAMADVRAGIVRPLPPLCLHVDERQMVQAFRRTERAMRELRREMRRTVTK